MIDMRAVLLAVVIGLFFTLPVWACPTPLPDHRIATPAADTPPEITRFLGQWNGKWKALWGNRWKETLCHTLVVQNVDSRGKVSVISSWGVFPPWGYTEPGYNWTVGTIADGKLVLRRFRNNAQVTYWFDGDALRAKWEKGSTIVGAKLTKVEQ